MNNSILTENEVNEILAKQKQFFMEGATLDFEFRIKQLQKLKDSVILHKEELETALKKDLGKSKFESYTTEIGFILSSISHTMKHLKKWMKPVKPKTPMHIFLASSKIEKVPYGSVLIMGPYNYPFQLLIEPLIGAIAAGNCAVLSPSELTPTVSSVVQKLIQTTFHKEYIHCVQGGIENNTALLNSPFDYIFFTGSINVGKIVMKAASKNLIPVTLELGGKSPVIVDKTANIKVASERIVWGKLMNAGQTCVAPDYIYVDESIRDEFVRELIKTIENFYGKDIKNNPDFGRIVNQRHIDRLKTILELDKNYIVYGGEVDEKQRYISPTLLCVEGNEAASMKEELFGPLLPILTYKSLEEALTFINNNNKPLALYIFSEDDQSINHILKNTSSGGVSINDTISHIISPNLPFGGIGKSGMGMYHGEYSFMTFSHQRSILRKSTKFTIRLPFPPFTEEKYKKLNNFLK